jgi:hypothetical protein
MDDAAGAPVQVDLDRVAGGVAEEPRLIAAVRDRVVEDALREGEYRSDVRGPASTRRSAPLLTNPLAGPYERRQPHEAVRT